MRTILMVLGLAWSSCPAGRSPGGSAAPVSAATPVSGPSAPAPSPAPLATRPCSPVTGPHTRDPVLAIACDGCIEKYSSNMGLPPGVTFDQCVDASAVRVRAKLALDPHYYDPVVKALLGP